MKLRVGMPLMTKNGQLYSNAVVYKIFEGEHRNVVHVLTDFGNLRIFPSVEDVLEQYDISKAYIDTVLIKEELDLPDNWVDGQFNIRDRLQHQIELLTKALEELE